MGLNVAIRALARVAVVGAVAIVLALAASDVFAHGDKLSPVTSIAPASGEVQSLPEFELPAGVILPEECVVEPRSVDELLETVNAAYSSGLPTAETNGPVVIESSDMGISVTIEGRPWIFDGQAGTDPPGPVADDATVAAVTAVLRERVACQNAGDVAHYLALHSDAWIADSFTAAAKPGPNGEPQVPEESWVQLLTSDLYEVYEPDWRPASEIVGVWNLADGRVAAIATPGMSWREEQVDQGAPPEVFVLANVDGTWLVDYSHVLVGIHH